MNKHTGSFTKGTFLFIILSIILFGFQVKQVAAAPSGAEPASRRWISRGEALLQAVDCSTQSNVPVSECEALVALYNQTGGASWTNHTGWLQTNTPCSWFGVTCGGGHVTRLSLPHNQLSGAIPTELGNLPYLQNLTLSQNQLTGGIPSTLGGLSSLQVLDLANNQLSGSIPPTLGNLSSLTQLLLSANQLSGSIPPELGNLAGLQNLSLSRNQLSGSIPTQLGSLTNLQYLYLSNNQLSGSIPSTLGGLTNLQYLYLSSNQLSGAIPPALGSLVNLQYLYLETNQLSGSIPTELGGLASVRTFALAANRLSGNIPSTLGNLSNLTVLLLGNNQLSGSIPAELGSLSKLQTIDLSTNQLSGAIPSTLGSLSSLQTMDFNENQLSGSIPSQLGNLSNLQNLYLANNRLNGSIPAALGSLSGVRIVELYNNQLSGPIPPQLGNLSNVINLLLGHNQLSGTLPAELGNLVNMDHLSVVDNPLYGTIPLSFTNLTNLSIFRFFTTSICEPTGAEFLAWKATVTTWLGTGSCPAKASPTDGQMDLPLTLNLSWVSATAPVTYYEYCYDISDNDTCDVWINNSLSTTASLSGLVRNTTYYWQVRWYTATDGPNYADSGTWWSFTTIPYPPAGFIKAAPANNATRLTANPTLTWDPSATPGVSYAVCYDSVNDNVCAGNAWQTVTSGTSYQLSGLNYNTTYYWQVRASNPGGDTYADSGAWWSFTTMQPPPAAFTKTTPANNDPSQPPNLTLSWTASDPGVTYQYCLSLSGGACGSEAEWVTVSGTSASPAGLSYNTTYYWQVRARNSENTITQANAGEWWRFTTYSQPPVGFTKISPANSAGNEPLSLSLSWSDAGAGFTYQYCVTQAAPFNCTGWTTVTATTVQVSGLANDATYFWQVRARDGSGHTTDANAQDANPIWQFSTRAAPPTSSDVTYNGVQEDQSIADDLPGANEMIFALSGAQPAGTLSLTTAGHFTYQPPLNFFGQVQFQFTVTDGVNDPTGPYTVTINYVSVNDPPVLDPIADITVHSGEIATFTLSASDPDLPVGSQLTYSISTLPEGASFDPASGVFEWQAAWSPAGPNVYTLTLTVSDGEPTADPVQRTVTITVLPRQVYLPNIISH